MSTSECSPRKRVIIGISGASGFLYGVQALRYLRQLHVESHVVISPAAHLTRSLETTLSEDDVHKLADVIYPFGDIAADIASGSFRASGMLIAPCSMNTLAAVAAGFTNSLLARAADVTLKERRRLVLMVRETPLLPGTFVTCFRLPKPAASFFHPYLPGMHALTVLRTSSLIVLRGR